MKQREIKFRAWDKEHKKMLTEESWISNYDDFYLSDLMSIFNRIDIIWMQYTGLRDKDGKEIYDGDILIITKENDCPENDHYFPIPINTLVVVEEIKNAWGLQRIERVKKRKENDNKCDACAAWWLSLWSENHEMPITCYSKVIGNIYENPELLKED